MNALLVTILMCLCPLANTCGSQVVVFTDVDDTLRSGGSIPLPGSVLDRSWTPNWMFSSEPYPGMAQFEKELEIGPLNTGTTPGVVILTARPSSFGSINSDSSVGQQLASVGMSIRDVEYGSHRAMIGIPFSHLDFAEEKEDDMKDYMDDNEDYNYIFVGDNGQGDLYAAHRTLQWDDDDNCLIGAYIHDVVNAPLTWEDFYVSDLPTFTPDYRITTFTTAADVAIKAVQNGDISLLGAQRILTAIQNSDQYNSCVPEQCTCEMIPTETIIETLEEFAEHFDWWDEVEESVEYLIDLIEEVNECVDPDCQSRADFDDMPPACSELLDDVQSLENFLNGN